MVRPDCSFIVGKERKQVVMRLFPESYNKFRYYREVYQWKPIMSSLCF